MAASAKLTIAELRDLDRTGLLDNWRTLHDRPPPHKASQEFLRRRFAYRLQEIEHGGLQPSIRRQLDAIATGTVASISASRARSSIKPGTRLIRTWQGKACEVSVVEDGFMFEGNRYRSLSAVARAITGTRWNGWLFFGLKLPRKRCSADR
jgi:hypothetical protein